MKHILLSAALSLFALAIPGAAQSFYSYDTSKLPDNVLLGGVGARVDASIPVGVSNVYGFVAYAKKATDWLYEYQQFSVQGGATTVSAGAAPYLGTLSIFGGKIAILGVAAPGVSFTPPSKTAAGAIGNIQALGGHGFVGIHTFKNGWHLVAGAGGARNFSNQAQVNSWDAHAALGVTWN